MPVVRAVLGLVETPLHQGHKVANTDKALTRRVRAKLPTSALLSKVRAKLDTAPKRLLSTDLFVRTMEKQNQMRIIWPEMK